MIDLLSLGIGMAIGIPVGSLGTYLAQIYLKMDAKNWLMLVVSIVWAISIVAEIFVPVYTTNLAVHALMGAVVGGFFDLKKAVENIKK